MNSQESFQCERSCLSLDPLPTEWWSIVYTIRNVGNEDANLPNNHREHKLRFLGNKYLMKHGDELAGRFDSECIYKRKE